MPFDEIRQRLDAVQRVRAQRDAAERRMPGERLRRELREAFAREGTARFRRNREAGMGMEPDPAEPPDVKRR